MTALHVVVSVIVALILAVWIIGRKIDRTVITPIDALDAIIEHLLR